MDKYKRLKQRHSLEFIEESILNGNIAYPIPQKLWDNKPEANGELVNEKLEAVLIYIVGHIVGGNRDSWFTNKPYNSVALQAFLLRRILGTGYRSYLDFLEQKEILLKSPYQIGKHSFKYNIPIQFQKSRISYREIIHSGIRRNIKNANRELFENNKALYQDYSNTIYWYSTKELKIDKVKADNYLFKFRDRLSLRMPASQITDDEILDTINNKIPSQLDSGEHFINKLNRKGYEIHIDPKGWRLYSSLTQLMSPLRNYINYDDKELCSIDIKNSQAFHFCFVLNENFWGAQQRRCSLSSLTKDDDYPLFTYFQNEGKPLLKEIRSILRISQPDIENYIELTTRGKLYEYLSENFSTAFPAFYRTRDSAKLRFLKFLNSEKANNYPDYELFKEKFPKVCFVIEALKSRDYKDISTILQRLEAKMLLHYFVNAFSTSFPDVPIFSIHDSIITLKDYKLAAIQTIENSYQGFLGFVPNTDGGKDLNHQSAINAIDEYLDEKTIASLKSENINPVIFEELLARFSD